MQCNRPEGRGSEGTPSPTRMSELEFAEVDPTGRYARYDEILGKGASKTVYRAFDEYEGIEVAWNQVKLRDFLQSPEELERLCSEIHLLKTLKHKNIMKFYASWVDVSGRNVNFITEMFTSGTLRQYRHKYRKVSMRAVKHWCRQILEGLLYLHSHDPPVIHRDLKCDNIFVNGNQGEVKIGDLGLAAVLSTSAVALCVGTPEFMAPEVYEEQYNELVDIYSFGMCILEMVTLEYPYSECTHPVQIYKKVTSGTMPDALFKVQDSKVRQFVEKCLTTVTERLSASELLKEPFLQMDDDLIPTCPEEVEVGSLQLQPSLSSCSTNGCLLPNGEILPEVECARGSDELKTSLLGTELLELQENARSPGLLITIKGKRIEDGSIFLRLRIEEKDGARNIYFYFDIEVDTALTVATEMVAQLEYLTNIDVMHIADMIDGELLSLIPEWRTGPCIEDSIQSTISSRGCLGDYINSIKHDALNLRNFQFSSFASGHSRFHEDRCQSDEIEWLKQEGVPSPLDSRLGASGASNQLKEESHAEVGASKRTFLSFRKNGRASYMKSSARGTMGRFLCGSFRKESVDISACSLNVLDGCDSCETYIENELRWLRSDYQRETVVNRSSPVEENRGCSSRSPAVVSQADSAKEGTGGSSSSHLLEENAAHILASSKSDLSYSNRSQRSDNSTRPPRQNNDVKRRRNSLRLFAARRFYTGILLRGCLPRKKSLKVDAIDR